MRQEQLYNGQTAAERKRKQTAIVSGAALANLRTPFEQWLAYGLLGLSFVGGMLAFNEGRLWPLAPLAIILGVGLQSVVTALEWMYQPKRAGLTGWYLVPLVFGAGSTLIGFGQHLHPSLAKNLAQFTGLHVVIGGLPGYTVAAGVILIIVALAVEIIPEAILVD